MVLVKILARSYQKPGCSHGWVAYNVIFLRLHHLHHHFNYVARRTKLSVSSGSCNFRKQVFVQIAFGVAVLHLYFINLLHYHVEQTWCGDHKFCIFHVLRKHTTSAPIFLIKVKHAILFLKEVEHVFRILVFKTAPTEFAFVLRYKLDLLLVSNQIRLFLF